MANVDSDHSTARGQDGEAISPPLPSAAPPFAGETPQPAVNGPPTADSNGPSPPPSAAGGPPPAGNGEAPTPPRGTVTDAQLERLRELKGRLFADQTEEQARQAWRAILARRNVTTALSLSTEQAEQLARNIANHLASQPAAPPPTTGAAAAGGKGSARRPPAVVGVRGRQLDHLKRLRAMMEEKAAAEGKPPEEVERWYRDALARRGATSEAALTFDQARDLAREIIRILRPPRRPQAERLADPHDLADLDLSQDQLADLRVSGLTDATILAARIHARSDYRITELLRWDMARRNGLGNCMVIPYREADGSPSLLRQPNGEPLLGKDGKPIPFVRIKPQKPLKDRKYESPRGVSPVPPYYPPGTLAALKDPSCPLLITEGEKKSLKADQEGFACIGLGGVDCWSKPREKDKKGRKKGCPELSDELAAVAWERRQVYIVYDSDLAEKAGVQLAEWRLARALADRGAVVKVVRLSAAEDGKKVGLDDFLIAKGADALRALIAEAAEPREPALVKAEKKVKAIEKAGVAVEDKDDPHALARWHLHPDNPFFGIGPAPAVKAEHLKVRYWQDCFLWYDAGVYCQLPTKEVAAALNVTVKRVFDEQNKLDLMDFFGRMEDRKSDDDNPPEPPKAKKVTANLMAAVRQALAAITLLPASVQPPAWLGDDRPFPADEILATRNALIHLPSLVANRQPFACDPTLRFFSLNVLDYAFHLDAPPPDNWLAFLAQLWPDDPGAIDLLQEWFGYCLLPDTSQQKILLVLGPKRSGKGTIARVLRALIGPNNVAGPTLSSLGTNFGLWPLLGKTVAIISDARLSGGHRDQDVIVERLLSISGEDALTVDRKNLEPVTTKLACRFTILTNELPRLGDSSGALPSRFLLLHTPRSWFGQEDHALTDRLLKELPGILLWAIEGWRRLRERGYFQQPEASAELMEEMADLSSPVSAFVKECCVLDPMQQATKQEIYDRFKLWCQDKGISKPPTAATFGRDLLAACPALRTRRPREGEDRQRVYQGIAVGTAGSGRPSYSTG